MTLTEFLLSRIAEDEYGARDGGIGPVSMGCFGTARVLAECEAKTEIVELHRPHPFLLDDDRGEAWECEVCGGDVDCSTLKALALPYSDHPDYRPEWRP